MKSAEALEKEIQNFINKSRKGVKIAKGKTPEIKSLERIKKLPEIKPKKRREISRKSAGGIRGLGLTVSEEIKKALESNR